MNGHVEEHQDEEMVAEVRTSGRSLSTADKGEGRAMDGHFSEGTKRFLEAEQVDGRGKRVRKKRRLSAAGEIDPNDLNDDGSVNKKTRWTSTLVKNGYVAQPPLTVDDKAYFARLDANARRPPLSDMKGPCPVWGKTRRALQSTAEYLRQPVKTIGASVEIGVGGIARGVILEGQIPRQGVFWGEGEQAGTIITYM